MKTVATQTEETNSVNINTAIEQTKRFKNLINNPEDVSLDKARLQSLYYCSEYFNKTDILKLLDQDGCDGIRIYRALDNDGKSILLMVAASKERDLLPLSSDTSDNTGNKILSSDENIRCPNMCNHEGLLNNP